LQASYLSFLLFVYPEKLHVLKATHQRRESILCFDFKIKVLSTETGRLDPTANYLLDKLVVHRLQAAGSMLMGLLLFFEDFLRVIVQILQLRADKESKIILINYYENYHKLL